MTNVKGFSYYSAARCGRSTRLLQDFKMAPIRYSLHYEDYSDHLMSRFGKLLQMQSLVDMTLMCSSHTLRVHKAVLAASSAYFQEVLQKQNCEPLVILKMRFSVLKCLVEFMYCGKTQCLEEHLDELVSAAQFLKIKGLSKVTKEGLGIANTSELPAFTPPVVINRPPKSLLQDNAELKKALPGVTPPTPDTSEQSSSLRSSKDPPLRSPYDMDMGGVDPTLGMDYANLPRYRPRRGRPSSRRLAGWESPPVLGRVAERALLKREHDSRKAIHQLKNLQSRQMQASSEFIDRVTLTQAVNSICPSESPSDNYMNFDADLLYLDQNISSSILDPNISLSKNNAFGDDNYNPSLTTPNKDNDSENVGTAMSEYVNALKSAGLPTDLPILLESGDGSYINVNEKVLIDMVQSNEIQYEVIEQPNIIEKVVDPTEIKSIDELSKSIERNELLVTSKNIQSSFFDKDSGEFLGNDEAINSLNAILPSNLDSFSMPDNFSVINNSMQVDSAINNDNTDISSIVNDMFSKSVTDNGMKNYYDECSKSKDVEQLCAVSGNLDTSFNMSFLDSKVPHFESDCMEQDYHRLNSDDLRRNAECYDFSLNLTQPSEFKDSDFDCLMESPKKQNNSDNHHALPYGDTDLIELRSSLQDAHEFENTSKLLNNFEETFDKNISQEKDHKTIALSGNEYQLKDFEKELDSLKKNEIAKNTNSSQAPSWGEIINTERVLDDKVGNNDCLNESETQSKNNTNEYTDNLQCMDNSDDGTVSTKEHGTTDESAGNKRSREKDNRGDMKHSKRKVKNRKCE